MRNKHTQVSYPDDPLATGQMANGSSHDQQWHDHEHLAEQVQLDAQKLVDSAGSVDLAKQAVEMAQARPSTSDDAGTSSGYVLSRDEFARRLGFISYLDMFEASTVHPTTDGGQWCITALQGGKWIVWNEAVMAIRSEFGSQEAAREEIERVTA